MRPELTDAISEAGRSSPNWLVYVAMVLLSSGAAALGVKATTPGERLAAIEAANARQDSVFTRIEGKLDEINQKIDHNSAVIREQLNSINALACSRVSKRELVNAQISCPQGMGRP